MRFAAIFIFLILPLGCCDKITPKIKWTEHVLTSTQDDRQEKLLKELFPSLNGSSDSLDGTSVVPHKELLSLADRTGVRDTDIYYSFNVPCAGDVHDPSELIIIVSGDKIRWARWPFAEF